MQIFILGIIKVQSIVLITQKYELLPITLQIPYQLRPVKYKINTKLLSVISNKHHKIA